MNHESLLSLSRAAMSALHRLTAPIPFPVAEGLALILAVLLLSALLRAALRHSLRPLRAPLASLLVLLIALALLWGPACAVPPADIPAPDAEALSWLCGELIGQLNASPLAFPAPAEALARAPGVAGAPARAVKAVRCPGWMRAAHLCGLFVPLTGEALADATAPAPLVPFTAVHELMHLDGIAGEGAANVAAWEKCLSAGGAFADSARLWALRYAMGLLRRRDGSAWQRARATMKGALARAFRDCGGEIEPLPARRLTLARADYAALAGYLAGGG